MWWLLGCDGPSFSQEWRLDRLRLLAVAAEPAEPVPGDEVSFSALSYVPPGEQAGSAWFACLDGQRRGCVEDPTLLEGLGALPPEELAERLEDARDEGLIGLLPGLPPAWTVPEDALYELDPEDLREGIVATVQVALATREDLELVVRLLPVSFASTPNRNPVVEELLADGEPLGDQPLLVEAGDEVELRALLEGGPEIYEYVIQQRGVPALELRIEEPEWRWYTDLGKLAERRSRKDSAEGRAVWTAPERPGQGIIHAVVLDGRGGMGWRTVVVAVY